MTVKHIISCNIDDKLDTFLAENGNYAKKPYGSSKMLSFIKSLYDYSFFNILFYKNENLLGFVPFFLIKSLFFGSRLISLPFAGHGGGLCLKKNIGKKDAEEIIKKLIHAIKELRKEEKIDSVIIRELNTNSEVYKKAGFVFGEEEYTFLISLSSEEEIWKSLDKKVRNGIRKARKEGLKLIIDDSVNDWHHLHKKTMKRLGTPPVKREHFEKLKKTFGPDFLIFFAEYKGKKIGDISFFVNDGCIFWSTNDCLEKYRHLNVSSFLLFECIKYGIAKKYRFLDLGVSRKNSNNFTFKMKWKPKIFNTSKKYYFFREERFISPNEKKYILFSSIWRKFVPDFVASLIGPKIRKGLGS